MTGAAAQVFVYYRVRRVDAAVAIAAVRALQAQFAATLPDLACTLSRRAEADANADPLTLMETYAHPGGVSEATRREIEARMQTALSAWLVGERHVEVFVTCA